jgi:hypothetical protein
MLDLDNRNIAAFWTSGGLEQVFDHEPVRTPFEVVGSVVGLVVVSMDQTVEAFSACRLWYERISYKLW